MSNQDQDPEQSPEIGQEAPTPSHGSSTGMIPPSPSSPGENVSTTFSIQPPEQEPPIVEPARGPAVPPDLNVPWSWGDLAVFFLFYFGSTAVLAVIIVIAAAAVLHVPVSTLVKSQSTLFISLSILAQALASFVAIFYLWVLARIRSAGPLAQPLEGPWRMLGWRPLGQTIDRTASTLKYVALGAGLALTVQFVSGLVGQRRAVPFEDLFQTRQTILMLMAFGILVAPIVEEMIFRGFLYPVVARQFGVGAGIVATGFLFGAFHAAQLWGAWEQIALLVIVGVVLTWARARSRTIVAGYVIHVAYNSTLFGILLVGTHGLKHLHPGS